MNKSKEFFEKQIERFDNEYRNIEEKYERLEKELNNMKYTLASYSGSMEHAKKERDFYQDLLDDLMNNEVNG